MWVPKGQMFQPTGMAYTKVLRSKSLLNVRRDGEVGGYMKVPTSSSKTMDHDLIGG